MRTYYLHNGQQQHGPFTIEQLKEQKIKPGTPVWYQGIASWTAAKEIDELKELLSSAAPPPFTTYLSSVPVQIPVKKKKHWTFKLGLVLAIIILGLIAYNQYQNTYPSGVSFASAARDLDAGGKFNIGPFGMKATIYGFIRNSSARTNYKDATIEITYYDKDHNIVSHEYKTINNYFTAGSSTDFQLKVDVLRGTKSIGWEVTNATAY